MCKSLAVALLAVLFAACPAAAQQRPGLATGSPAGGESTSSVPAPAPPASSSARDDGDRQAPGMINPSDSSGGAKALRDENALLKRKVDILEKQVELLRQRVKSLESGQ